VINNVRSGIGALGFAPGVICLLMSATLLSLAQTNRESGQPSAAFVTVSGSPRAAEEIVREIHDPATGDRWLLKRDDQHPDRPGRMVLVAPEKLSPAPARAFLGEVSEKRGSGSPVAMIHAGDYLIVEEHTSLLDAVFEAVALTPARAGGTFRVRLSIGGRVVNAVAVAPGRALLSYDSGAQP
jgi:hypothetical protein